MLTELDELRYTLLGSFHEFIKYFYYLRNGATFNSPHPVSRRSHVSILCEELSRIARLEELNLMLNLPPGHGKSTFLVYFLAWTYAHYHDCQNIYISYSSELAETHTAEVKAIMSLSMYKTLFQTSIDPSSSAKGDFKVIHATKPGSGRTVARGSAGGITGINGGLQYAIDEYGKPRFSGIVIMDDLHKPDEVHSDLRRERVIKNYNETIKMRRRSNNVGMVLLGQRLHEDDICQFILDGKDGEHWRHVVLQSLDGAENALAPHIISKERLLVERKFNEYAFYSQHQQTPMPAGGGIFKTDWFKVIDYEPDVLYSFITADTAESQAEYADYTAMSFWGVYKIKIGAQETSEYGLHRISHRLLKCEPNALKDEFLDYYTECLRYKCPVSAAAIEKKSTGTTLISLLKGTPGLRVINIERSAASGNKTTRFLECQRYVAEGKISLNKNSKNMEEFVTHMGKITANNSHRHDDLADTMADAIKLTYIDKIILYHLSGTQNYDNLANNYGLAQAKTGQHGRFK